MTILMKVEELRGKYIYNGSILTGDAGVIYYDFVPDQEEPEVEYEYSYAYSYDYSRSYEEARKWMMCGMGMIVLTIGLITPIPGDEAIGFGMLVGFFGG